MEKPSTRPNNPNYSSGPCSKRPGWSLDALKDTPIGRSHRAKECKDKLNEVIVKSKKILGLPDDYHLGVMTGSNTGALEAALWSLLGLNGVASFWKSAYSLGSIDPSSADATVVFTVAGLS